MCLHVVQSYFVQLKAICSLKLHTGHQVNTFTAIVTKIDGKTIFLTAHVGTNECEIQCVMGEKYLLSIYYLIYDLFYSL